MARAERNTYGLPRGDAIRKELRSCFRSQRAQVLAAIGPKPSKDYGGTGAALPGAWPEFVLGRLAMSERFTPLLSVLWQSGGAGLFARVGLDPDEWRVTNPHTESRIRNAALDFCAATNATTSLELNAALARVRSELVAGVVDKGESVAVLTKRVNAIFDKAETSRARAIAQSEASRAVHAAAEEAAHQSGLVAGWQWLLSGDACPLCQTIGRRAAFVPLGQPFAVVGDNPTYSTIRYPPGHPHCNCSWIEILKPEAGGPSSPEWSPTLHQPKPEAEDYHDGKLPAKRKKAA